MNKIVPNLTAVEHFGNTCAFWNSRDDWFLQRDQAKVHLYNGSLRLVDITNAMKPGKTCEEFTFNWYPVHDLPVGIQRLFARHAYDMRSLFKELGALAWEHRKHWKTGEPRADWQEFNLPQLIALLPADEFGARIQAGTTVDLYRQNLQGIRVWSPFVTVNPLPKQPVKWTISHVIRALLSGQFTDLKCDGVYSDDYAWDNAVNFQRGQIKNAAAFARRIIESPSGWWAHERNGEISICCHHFDSNSFRFSLTPNSQLRTPNCA